MTRNLSCLVFSDSAHGLRCLARSCANCSGLVERTLRNTAGVLSAEVNLLAHKAVVRFQAAPGDVAPAAARLAEEVESVGFEATVLEAAAAVQAEKATLQVQAGSSWNPECQGASAGICGTEWGLCRPPPKAV